MSRAILWRTALAAAVPILLSSACASTGPNPSQQPPNSTPHDRPAGTAELTLVTEAPRNGDGPRAFGLTGAEKPNGTQYRFRVSVPDDIPTWLEGSIGEMELRIAEQTPDGWLAFYKGPLHEDWRNSDYRIRMYDGNGGVVWEVDPARHFAAASHREIQDVRYGDGALYLNAACMTYSAEARGSCSRLLRIEPRSNALVWRTDPLVSNNIFLLHDRFVISGYGFTAEPDHLYLVDRATGRVVASQRLDSAHEYMEIRGDGRLVVLTSSTAYTFALPD